MIKEQIGFTGQIQFDSSKPDGTMRKLQDVSRLNALGWSRNMVLSDGISKLSDWYLELLVSDRRI